MFQVGSGWHIIEIKLGILLFGNTPKNAIGFNAMTEASDNTLAGEDEVYYY